MRWKLHYIKLSTFKNKSSICIKILKHKGIVTYTFDPTLVKLRQGDYHDYIMEFQSAWLQKEMLSQKEWVGLKYSFKW